MPLNEELDASLLVEEGDPGANIWILGEEVKPGSFVEPAILLEAATGLVNVFSHLTFALLFLFGHWWHASRTLYRDLLSGLEGDTSALVEFGAYRKVGDVTTSSS